MTSVMTYYCAQPIMPSNYLLTANKSVLMLFKPVTLLFQCQINTAVIAKRNNTNTLHIMRRTKQNIRWVLGSPGARRIGAYLLSVTRNCNYKF